MIETIRDDVVIEDGCWLWQRCIDKAGYAFAGQTTAHRYVWALYGFEEAEELHHLCGVRHCVNPEHLVPTTKYEHKRKYHRGTECKRGHRFNEENTYIRSDGRQACRACSRDRARQRLGITPDRYRVTS